MVCTRFAIDLWLEYVESHLNVGDGPSRELQRFALSDLALEWGIETTAAQLPQLDRLFRSPVESVQELFEVLRSLDLE